MILTNHTLKHQMIPFKMIIYKKKLMNQILQKVPRIAPIAECRVCLHTLYIYNSDRFCSYKCRLYWENGIFGC
jgi:hypothetical protein